jgi:hypothetical protein
MNTYEFDVYDDQGYWGSIRHEGESVEEARNDCKSYLSANELEPLGSLTLPCACPLKTQKSESMTSLFSINRPENVAEAHRPKPPKPPNFPRFHTLRIDKVFVLLTDGPDKVFLQTDFPCPYVKEFMPEQTPLSISFDTTYDKGVEYVKKNFNIEPEVSNCRHSRFNVPR